MHLTEITQRFADIVSRVTNCASPTLAITVRPSYSFYVSVVSEALTWAEVKAIANGMRTAGFSLLAHGGSTDCIVTFEDGSEARGFNWAFSDPDADWEERRAADEDQWRFAAEK